MMSVALIGNPNTGKTSLFNALTSSYEYVGNWSGVTVEKKVGTLRGRQGQLVDLPGLYSLSPLSKDEAVVSHYLLDETPQLILNVVDASQLSRNLHLTMQMLEYESNAIIALNMMDVAQARGMDIHISELSTLLGVPIIPVVARNEKGCDDIAEALASPQNITKSYQSNYGVILETAIEEFIQNMPAELRHKRWLALQFYEGNEAVTSYLHNVISSDWLNKHYKDTLKRVSQDTKVRDLKQYIRKQRTDMIDRILEKILPEPQKVEDSFSNKLDRVLTNKFLGIPIFLLFMYLTFKLTFNWIGSPLSDMLDEFLNGFLVEHVEQLLVQAGAAQFIIDLIVDGIIAGVGGVLVFVPQIFILFLIISFIEDSGYMARIATVMDKLMEGVGLNGKAFIPMIIGFGCNVPGIMAARTIEQPKERLLTILLTPLMSCSARLTVYSLFVGTFFASHQAGIVLSLYVLGVIVALLLAKLFSATLAKDEESLFVIELPPYRIPQWRTLGRSTWEKGKGFVKKAGTFIFGGSVFIWLLSYSGPHGFQVPIDQSFMKYVGSAIAPLFAPIGFDNWQAAAALITGFLAKEVVVSSMNIIYAAPTGEGLQAIIQQFFTPLQAYSFLVFVLLYVPCLATVGVIRKETASAKWTWFSAMYALIVAYLISFIIYRAGLLFGL